MSVATTRLCALAFVGLFLLSGPVVAQDLIPGTAVATKRTQALTLSDRGRHPEALPLLEELTQVLPNDALVWERYAIALLSTAGRSVTWRRGQSLAPAQLPGVILRVDDLLT